MAPKMEALRKNKQRLQENESCLISRHGAKKRRRRQQIVKTNKR